MPAGKESRVLRTPRRNCFSAVTGESPDLVPMHDPGRSRQFREVTVSRTQRTLRRRRNNRLPEAEVQTWRPAPHAMSAITHPGGRLKCETDSFRRRTDEITRIAANASAQLLRPYPPRRTDPIHRPVGGRHLNDQTCVLIRATRMPGSPKPCCQGARMAKPDQSRKVFELTIWRIDLARKGLRDCWENPGSHIHASKKTYSVKHPGWLFNNYRKLIPLRVFSTLRQSCCSKTSSEAFASSFNPQASG